MENIILITLKYLSLAIKFYSIQVGHKLSLSNNHSMATLIELETQVAWIRIMGNRI